MSVTPEIEAEILAIYRANPKRFSTFKAGRKVGVSSTEVMAVVAKHRDTVADGREHNGGAGRPELEPFIVASKRASEPWNNKDTGVAHARAAYCAGTHDMATHRDGAWLHLCLFKLARPRPARPNFFAKAVV